MLFSKDINVLCADDNKNLIQTIGEYIDNQKDMNLVGTACDGVEAYNMILLKKPDIVVLDVVMPKLDGIGVIEKINQNNKNKHPNFIITSGIGNDTFIKQITKLSSDTNYYMLKPFDYDVLIARIRQLFHMTTSDITNDNNQIKLNNTNDAVFTNTSLENKVSVFLNKIRTPSYMIGYQYLKEAILQVVKDPLAIYSITKILYPHVAQKYNTSPSRVERAIRNVIDCIWTKKSLHLEEFLFEDSIIDFKNKRPKPSELIALIADNLKINKSI